MLKLHEDPVRLAESLSFTEADTGFSSRLLEKDYYCSVMMEHLSVKAGTLVFKGGTCLAKVYANFFRLSEDLDFVIPMEPQATRGDQRTGISPIKEAFALLEGELPCFRISVPLRGANASTQYLAEVSYRSVVSAQPQSIKVEVAMREPLLLPPTTGVARTALLDPLNEQPLLPTFPLRCMSLQESFAEKLRAALTRREVAARDFFDIDYAVRSLGLRPDDEALVDLVRRKLSVPGNGSVDVSPERFTALRQQFRAQLEPVLRPGDFSSFDVKRASAIVANVAGRL